MADTSGQRIRPAGDVSRAIIETVIEGRVRWVDVAVIVAAVGVLAGSGVAMLLWAEGREYRDNQRNWALIGGWSGIVGAGLVLLLTVAAIVRHRGSRRAQLTFASALLVGSAALFGLALVFGN